MKKAGSDYEGDNSYEYAKKHFDRIVLAKKYLNQIEAKVMKPVNYF